MDEKTLKQNIKKAHQAVAELRQAIKEMNREIASMKEELKKAQGMESKDYYPEEKWLPFNADKCLEAIDGNTKSLDDAFDWGKTPQGDDYWYNIYYKKAPLSNDDKITLLRWVVNYYKAQQK